MKKPFATLCCLLLFATTTSLKAQTTIKSNALYWAVAIPNVGIETRLGNHFTFNVDLTASLWKEIKGKPYLGMQLIPEFRYYPKAAFNGFYVGGFTGMDAFRTSKWNYSPSHVQDGVGICLGLSLGYELPIAKRWSMDFYAGGGWHLAWYYGTNITTGERYVGWNRSAETIPYKLGVTFAYRLKK